MEYLDLVEKRYSVRAYKDEDGDVFIGSTNMLRSTLTSGIECIINDIISCMAEVVF